MSSENKKIKVCGDFWRLGIDKSHYISVSGEAYAFANRRHDVATAEFLEIFPVSMTVPSAGRKEEGCISNAIELVLVTICFTDVHKKELSDIMV